MIQRHHEVGDGGIHPGAPVTAVALFDRAELAVERFDRLQRPAIDRSAVGVVADDPAVRTKRRRHVGEHPVMIAVLRAVHDVGEDLALRLDRVPQQLEHGARHVGMTDEAVRHLLLKVIGLNLRVLLVVLFL